MTGATVILHSRFDPAATLAAFAQDRPTLTVLVPSTLQAVLEHPAWPGADLSSLRAVTTGSTVVPPGADSALHGPRRPRACRCTARPRPARSRSTRPSARPGRRTAPAAPARSARLSSWTRAGRAPPPAADGEVLVRGPAVFSGYWNDQAATAEALRDGWFHTGDIGRVDVDGAWRVHDRKKNLIVSGGENIYPAEIERVLREHPAVLEAAVVGAPGPALAGGAGRACRAAAGRGLHRRGAEAHIRAASSRGSRRRAKSASPTALPRNAMGKVQHALLRTAC